MGKIFDFKHEIESKQAWNFVETLNSDLPQIDLKFTVNSSSAQNDLGLTSDWSQIDLSFVFIKYVQLSPDELTLGNLKAQKFDPQKFQKQVRTVSLVSEPKG